MPPLVDPEDLIDATTVARLLGLSDRRAVSVYRRRYDDFPAPSVERGQNIVLWLRQEVEAWREANPGKRVT